MEGSLAGGWADNIKPLLLRAEARARVRTRARYLDRETWAGLSACLLNGSDDWSPDPASCLSTINSNQSQLDELSKVKSRPSPCRKLAILNEANVWKCHNCGRYIWKHCQRHNTPEGSVQSISQVLTQILVKFHFKNLDQAKISKSQPNISKSTKLRILTKHSESRPNIDSKIPIKLQLKNLAYKLQLQNPDKTLCSKSEPKQTNKNRRSPHTLPSCKPAGERRGGMTHDRWSRGEGVGGEQGMSYFSSKKTLTNQLFVGKLMYQLLARRLRRVELLESENF